MKANNKAKIKYIVHYIVYSLMEAVLLLFKFICNEFKERR